MMSVIENKVKDQICHAGSSVTRFGEISPLWQNSESLWATFQSLT